MIDSVQFENAPAAQENLSKRETVGLASLLCDLAFADASKQGDRGKNLHARSNVLARWSPQQVPTRLQQRSGKLPKGIQGNFYARQLFSEARACCRVRSRHPLRTLIRRRFNADADMGHHFGIRLFSLEIMNIRPATFEDVDAISNLIAQFAHYFLPDRGCRGAERFLEGISPQAILGYVTSTNFYYLVAVSGSDVVGAVALRDGRHLFHLFVAPAWQRMGIARTLLSAAKKGRADGVQAYTVNSSLNAVAVYEKFGFTPTGPRSEVNGIAFIPMKAQMESHVTHSLNPSKEALSK